MKNLIKYTFALFVVTLIATNSFTQEYVCQWIREQPLNCFNQTIDNDGNILIIHDLTPSEAFSIYGYNFTYDSNGFLFLKLDEDLNLLSSEFYETQNAGEISKIKVLADNTILVAGSFNIHKDFLPVEFQETEYYSASIIHMGSEGTIENIIVYDGDTFTATDVEIDLLGNYYITTNYQDTLHVTDTSFTPNDYLGSVPTGLLLKYNENNEFQWGLSAYQLGKSKSSFTSTYNLIKTDNSNNIYVAGNANGYMYSSGHIFCVNSNGDELWSWQNSASNLYIPPDGTCNDLEVNKDESAAYIVLCSYGPFLYYNEGEYAPGSHFITKFDSEGNVCWDFDLGGTAGSSQGRIDFKNDSIYFSNIFFDSISINDEYVYNIGHRNLHLGVIDTDGTVYRHKFYELEDNAYPYVQEILYHNDNLFIRMYDNFSYPLYLDTCEFTNEQGLFMRFKWDETYSISKSISTSKEISLFPNPASNKIYIETNKESIQNIEITDTKGRRIKNISGDINKIDISDLNPGVYIVTINSEKGSQIKKLVVN